MEPASAVSTFDPAQTLARAGDSMEAGRIAVARDRLAALAGGTDGARGGERLREAAEEFEAVFLGRMLAPMFEGLSTDGPFGGGHAETVYRAMMVDEMGKSIARSGGIGIADAVYQELLRLQEV